MVVATLTVALLLAGELHPNRNLERGIQQVQRLQEAEAVRTLELAQRSPDNSPEQLAQIYLWLGLAFAGLNQDAKVKESFHAALLLEPALRLPPHSSPRIEQQWRDAGGMGAPVAALPEVAVAPVARPAPPPARVAPPPPPFQPPAQTRAAEHRGYPALRVAGITVAAAGLAGVAAGIVSGARMTALSASARGERELDTALAEGTAARHAGQTANVLFAVGGGLGLAGGTLLGFSF